VRRPATQPKSRSFGGAHDLVGEPASTSPDHAPGGPAVRLCIYCDARSYIW
jgi:hypothetical protein